MKVRNAMKPRCSRALDDEMLRYISFATASLAALARAAAKTARHAADMTPATVIILASPRMTFSPRTFSVDCVARFSIPFSAPDARLGRRASLRIFMMAGDGGGG